MDHKSLSFTSQESQFECDLSADTSTECIKELEYHELGGIIFSLSFLFLRSLKTQLVIAQSFFVRLPQDACIK